LTSSYSKRRPQPSTLFPYTTLFRSSGQTFVIAGLLDHQVRDNFSKVPGIGDIPVLGKLFQSKSISRSNSELLVIITQQLGVGARSEEHTSELQSRVDVVCRLLLESK